ncbi:MAG: hypothetical protein IPQ09_22925 [Myxococcales bacterium]|nr:hypothetical protein [Myxococcales bacterium]
MGELYVEGFDVTHTKDGIQWGDDEQDIAYAIRNLLDEEEMPLLDQANGYRAKKSASMLPVDFGREAIIAAAAATATLEISTEMPTDRTRSCVRGRTARE